MRKIETSDLLDLDAYERERSAARARVIEIKRPRRIHLGEHLTFLFENFETMRYQVQEMLRIERRTSTADVQHELETYNELLPDPGQLTCTFMIEIEDEQDRAEKLGAWLGLQEHVFLELDNGQLAWSEFDPRQVGEERLSSVQYLRFQCGGHVPHAIVCDFPGLEERVCLTPEQAAALADDLRS